MQGYLVAQIEETIAWMMGMQAQLGTVGGNVALGAHHEGPGAAVAELKFTLGAGEMHAATPESKILEIILYRINAKSSCPPGQ